LIVPFAPGGGERVHGPELGGGQSNGCRRQPRERDCCPRKSGRSHGVIGARHDTRYGTDTQTIKAEKE
jgi:hypothetical protein